MQTISMKRTRTLSLALLLLALVSLSLPVAFAHQQEAANNISHASADENAHVGARSWKHGHSKMTRRVRGRKHELLAADLNERDEAADVASKFRLNHGASVQILMRC